MPVLRHAMIGRIDQMRRNGVAQPAQRIAPSRIKHPLLEVRHVLDQDHRAAVIFRASHHGPSRAAQRVMVRPFAASCPRMPLAGWRSQHNIMRGHRAPVGLLKVLALVPSVRVVGLVVLNSERPMVCGPHDARAGKARALGEATGPRKGGHAKIRPIRYHKPASYVEVCMHASWL